MNAQGFGPDGKPIGNQQKVQAGFGGMDMNMQAKGFDKDGNLSEKNKKYPQDLLVWI